MLPLGSPLQIGRDVLGDLWAPLADSVMLFGAVARVHREACGLPDLTPEVRLARYDDCPCDGPYVALVMRWPHVAGDTSSWIEGEVGSHEAATAQLRNFIAAWCTAEAERG